MQTSYWEKNGYLLRLACAEDAENYYAQNFNPLDPETARLTGCRPDFSREEVLSFFLRSLEDADRRFFLLLSPEGRIIGESVLSEIDQETRCANFRIAIFHPSDCGRGIGSWAVHQIRDFAFAALRLHRLELDVFSFNHRAEQAYLTAGFRREGVRRDAVRDGSNYADDILMAILEEDWRGILQKERQVIPEFWDIYDRSRRKTGRFQRRGDPMDPDDYHLVVEIWLMNPRGEVLLTRRHPDKHYGGLWECTGGAALSGEDSLAAALREVQEEIGADLSQGEPGILLASRTIRQDAPGRYSGHFDVYLFRREIPLKELSLQPEEVVDAKWVNRAEYERMKAAGEMAPVKADPFERIIDKNF